MGFEIRSLNKEEQAALEDGLRLSEELASTSGTLQPAQIQKLYDTALECAALDDATIIAIGLAFGQDLKLHGGYEWVRVSGAWGEETCLAVPRLTIFCSPISMIQKRLE